MSHSIKERELKGRRYDCKWVYEFGVLCVCWVAGETAPGRVIQSGLYRMAPGGESWDSLTNGLPDDPAIRAIAMHPHRPGVMVVGTQEGPYRSEDHGDHWEKVNVPDHGTAVWSLLFHPHDDKIMYAGYENCEIYRSDDGGERWFPLPVSVRFPDITTAPGANPAKRVLMLDASTSDPDMLYGAVEVGGVIRSTDGGEHWENLSHGHYLNDDAVDMHGVLASRWRPGTVFSIGRAGMFCSEDEGEYWSHVRLNPLNEKGQIYCRDIQETPGDPKTIWVAAGGNFQSDVGVLLRSKNGGRTWNQVEMGVEVPHTMFALAFDPRLPQNMYCATNGGEVYGSEDGGESWRTYDLPEGATQIYTMACG